MKIPEKIIIGSYVRLEGGSLSAITETSIHTKKINEIIDYLVELKNKGEV